MSKPIQPAISRKRKRRKVTKSPYKAPASNSNPLSSLNLANILSHFLTVRSVIKDLSTSLKRLENILDSLYQMFEIAQTFMAQKQREPGRPLLRLVPPRTQKKSPFGWGEDDSPSGDSPSNSPVPFPGNIDINQIMALLQSPLVQNLLSQWMKQLPPGDDLQQKQG
ncbi:hypothetical protein CLV97_11775 [Planifilum fimeticola]|jgi:hypothetical protein|uniref:Uncharacterized protein n=1 Tax=Planifilum fimeticola TaxID=201975 RepID=A0A2T0LDJ8_9BACL|nr:hypothetical protein [Planifilum fimeticola]PRX40091.1 hypothetical protein CLV97_11775 [Planifilum fimeticola]